LRNEFDVGANLRVRPCGGLYQPNDTQESIDGQESNDTQESIDRQESNNGQTRRSAPTLGKIIQWFKTMSTNEYIRGVKQKGWKPFIGKLWQRNYYDNVIWIDENLYGIRRYIIDNPVKWENDENNPKNFKTK
jgi:hypothetical protein